MTIYEWQIENMGIPSQIAPLEHVKSSDLFSRLVDKLLADNVDSVRTIPSAITPDISTAIEFKARTAELQLPERLWVVGETPLVPEQRQCIALSRGSDVDAMQLSTYLLVEGEVLRADTDSLTTGAYNPPQGSEYWDNKQLDIQTGFDCQPVALSEVEKLQSYIQGRGFKPVEG